MNILIKWMQVSVLVSLQTNEIVKRNRFRDSKAKWKERIPKQISIEVRELH